MKKIIRNSPVLILFGVIFFLAMNSYADVAVPNNLDQAKALYYENMNSSYEQFNQIVNNEPRNEKARMDLIRILRETGQYQTAISQLKILIQQNPDERRYRVALLESTFMAGELAETLQLSNTTDLSPDELYWKGLALTELGIGTEAIQALSDSIAGEPFRPLAYYNLGILYLKFTNYEKAITFFKKAAAQDPDMNQVYLPLAQAYIGLGKYLTAYNYLLVAQEGMSWNQEVSFAIKKLLADHPEMFKSQSNDTQEQERITIPPQVTPIIEDRDKIPEIRIGLAERIRNLYLRTGDRFHLTDQAGKILFSGKAQAVLWIRQKNFRIEVLNRLGERLFRTTNSVFLSYDNPSATTVLFEVQYLHGSFWAGRDDRIYRGRLQFSPRDNGLTIINRLNIEEYLYGVIPSEMEYIWPTEALEAQAIAARTYAISHKNAFNSRGFDLLPTIASQVYGGVRAERVSTNIAVDATRGRILTYNSKPICAFYTGNSGGYTASSLDLWGDNVPYLQAVPDKLLPIQDQLMGPEELAEWLTTRPQTYSNNPKYSAQSHFRWTAWISRLEIERRLRLGDKLGRINSIEISGRTRTGVVTKVTINGTIGNYTITGDAIRAKLGGLRSNMFILEPKFGKDDLPEFFIFNGGGWGHGVGLDQSGAAGMAADGYQCEEILSHYYPGTELDQLY